MGQEYRDRLGWAGFFRSCEVEGRKHGGNTFQSGLGGQANRLRFTHPIPGRACHGSANSDGDHKSVKTVKTRVNQVMKKRIALNRAHFLALCLLLLTAGSVWAQIPYSAAFTYQGRLTEAGIPASGTYDMQFKLFDVPFIGTGTQQGHTIANSALQVANGVFTVTLDFGANVFDGTPRFIEVSERPGGSVNPYNVLDPRQAVSPAPYAIYSLTAKTAASVANGAVVTSLNSLKDDVTLAAGPNVTITPNGNTLTLAAVGVGGSGIWSVFNNNAFYMAGNIGIGTTAPLTPLEVNGVLRSRRSNNAGQYLQLDGGDPFSIRMTAQSIPSAEKTLVIQNLSGETIPGANNSIQFAVGTTAAPSTRMTITKDGNVLMNPKGGGTISFGTPNFETGMSIDGANRADVRFDGSTLKLVVGPGGVIPPSANGIAIDPAGNVGIGTTSPGQKLDVAGNINYGQLSKLDVAENFTATVHAADFLLGHSSRHGNPGHALVDFNTTLHLNFAGDWATTQIGGATTYIEGNASVKALTIRGGADVAEPFAMPEGIAKGSVVVIDDAHAGELKLSGRAYDTRVAGIVSGANGINPGIALHQEGALEGGQEVALSGRVYARADATYGAIKPGDLLTTSATPGHAMRVTDYARAQGAILGKAMSSLEVGKGMVLVLVTLQ